MKLWRKLHFGEHTTPLSFFLLLFAVVLYRLVRSVQMMLRCLSLNSASEFSFVTKAGHFFFSLPIVIAFFFFFFLCFFSVGVGEEIYFP